MKSWLPIVANVEPKAGGKYEISWAKERPSIGCKILIYEPNKCLLFEWKGPVDESFISSSLLDIQVMIYFLPIDCDKMNEEQFTEVRLILTSFNDLGNDEEIKIWIESAWANAFEKLIEHVNDVF